MVKQPVGDDSVGRMQFLLTMRRRGIGDANVLRALDEVPREHFVGHEFQGAAYADQALPIACGQTISQPYVVAYMTEQLGVRPLHKVLEIGTGSGYQCAVLAQLVEKVYTVERIEELLRNARRRFRKLGITNVRSRHADGRLGWPEEAPFDAIILTAAGAELDSALLDQLAPDGCLIAPVGPAGRQILLRVRKDENGWVRESLGSVSFVPLLGGVG